jgi:hypothetical protein
MFIGDAPVYYVFFLGIYASNEILDIARNVLHDKSLLAETPYEEELKLISCKTVDNAK